MDVCQIDWKAIAQFCTAGVLAVGLVYTIKQVTHLKRVHNDENRITISERTIHHNKSFRREPLARLVVASLLGLNAPIDEKEAALYWAFREVHQSHVNLIWQVWELAGTPGKGENLKPGYEGWQRFAREIVAKKLRAAALAVGEDKNKPENKAGADWWKGLSEYEVTPPRLFEWLQWLAESES